MPWSVYNQMWSTSSSMFMGYVVSVWQKLPSLSSLMFLMNELIFLIFFFNSKPALLKAGGLIFVC